MNQSGQTIRIIFFVAIATLLSIAVILFLNIQRLIDSYSWVAHTRAVELKVQKAYSGIKHAESSVRAYVISRDTSYLQEKRNFEAMFPEMIKELKEMVGDNPKQVFNMQQFEFLVYQRLQHLNTTLDLHSQGATIDQYGERLALERPVMQRLETLTSNMYREEFALLAQREKTKNYYVRQIPLYLVLLTIVLLLLLILIFNHLQRQLKTLKATQSQLLESNVLLESQKKALQLSNEELESFNYIASHDLKEPLRKIRTFASIINKEELEGLSEKGKHNFDRLQASAARMQNLLDDLLAYTRLRSSTEMLEEVSLENTTVQIQENLQEIIRETGTIIETHNLPVIKGIPFQMYQLFENLLNNAIKYRRKDVTNKVVITGSEVHFSDLPDMQEAKHRYYHRIVVKDNGIGFPQEYAKKVFDIFARLHLDRNLSGTGIGLTICKKVVENHEGLIYAESSPGAGTSFIIYLPQNI